MIVPALTLLAVDPHGLGGAMLHGAAGPERERLLAEFDRLLPDPWPRRRIPPGITHDRLFGGLDLAATQAEGRPVHAPGLLTTLQGGVAVVPMAERVQPTLATGLLQLLDGEAGVAGACTLVLDESLPDEAGTPAALLDRLAFRITLDPLALRGPLWDEGAAAAVAAARARLPHVTATEQDLAAIATAALAFGVGSPRADRFALRVARAAAAFAGRDAVREEDLVRAGELVLIPRATRIPAPPDAPPPPPPPPPDQPESQEESAEPPSEGAPLADRVLEAVTAKLPASLLASLGAARKGGGSGKGGRMIRTPTHGRRIGTRPGDPRRARIDIVETLRAAAPWQRLRARKDGRLAIRRDDFRIQRLEHQGGTTVIFAVDASGSAALHRLAEAKGAVELLLAESYVRRDRVALISFRGATAELMLPPTRSLARARRALAGLPGGGGTPLAKAIVASSQAADQVMRERDGGSALVVFLTDARANVALDGTGGRPQAEADAQTAARAFRLTGVPAVLIDTSPRPSAYAATLAGEMGARYLPLPVADARGVSRIVQAARSGMVEAGR